MERSPRLDEFDWEQRVRSSFAKQGLMNTLGATLESVASGTVEIALRPIASITAYELPDRDLPLIADCGKRPTSRLPPTGLAPIH